MINQWRHVVTLSYTLPQVMPMQYQSQLDMPLRGCQSRLCSYTGKAWSSADVEQGTSHVMLCSRYADACS